MKRGLPQTVDCPTCGADAGRGCTVIGWGARRVHYAHVARKREAIEQAKT